MGTKRVRSLAAVSLLLGLAGAGRALAEDTDPGPQDRLARAVDAIVEARHGKDGASLIAFRHGEVTLVADLARVDVTLEIENHGPRALEWQRHFVLDPSTELIGAALVRQGATPIEARTLTLADARRIYTAVRSPRPRPTRLPPMGPWNGYGRRDPLRLERPAAGALDVSVFPIARGERVQVELHFVSPLHGRGTRLRYVDPILGIQAGRPANARAVVTTPADAPPVRPALGLDTDWVIDAGGLAVAGTPTGMVAAGAVGGRLRFVGTTDVGPRGGPTLPLRVPETTGRALAVPGGGLGTEVAVFRFDPAAFLKAHGLRVPADARLHLLRHPGETSRIAPWAFERTSDPLPVTARLHGGLDTLRLIVEVSGRDGTVLARIPVEMPVDRLPRDAVRDGALTGWHRAALVARVVDWAAGSAARTEKAMAFAVDLGVLRAGTAALAVPKGELDLLDRQDRRAYRHEGAPLGAQAREADFRSPPLGSVTR